MLSLLGAPALSPFRIDRLLSRLMAIEPTVTGLASRFVHFADLSEPLSERELLQLNRLLNYGPQYSGGAERGEKLTVTPRIGTVSPWSSKATDIAHVCGLTTVRRLERGTIYFLEARDALSQEQLQDLAGLLHDRMTESTWIGHLDPQILFQSQEPRALRRVPLMSEGPAALRRADREWGLALSDDEIDYLTDAYAMLGRDPTDAELMMFAQANSEHCRHKIFNADFVIDGEPMPKSLFSMIRATYESNPRGVLSAYRDNAAVIEGRRAKRFFPDPATHRYTASDEQVDILLKVETHNHPTAISPFPGAATGSGGEIRDEGATGIGAKPKAGLCGFSVSNLRIPAFTHAWEIDCGRPGRISSALEIMIQGPLGAAAYNNEFGRPNICGYFRVFEQASNAGTGLVRGYHKPIMIAGGLGNIRRAHVEKKEVSVGAALIVLGGPAMLIGLGGGAASSLGSGQSSSDLDFASVQRDNPEMQRRAQEVIDRCWQLGTDNPILLIHDVGAGGLSNALPEAIAHSHRGGHIDLRRIPSAEAGLSPLEIWCNEAQERYVIALMPGTLPRFAEICARERCPYALVGEVTSDGRLLVTDPEAQNDPVDMPIDVLLGKPPRMLRKVRTVAKSTEPLSTRGFDIAGSIERVLRLPTVADKTFLVTIGDRTVGGMISRDQMVGPWQVPVSDVGVTLSDYEGYGGEAMAMGERTPIAVLDAPASGRMAVAEAVTNIAAADVAALQDIRLSANWMAAAGQPGEDADLYATVRAVGEELCAKLGITIPVGKDSLSMRTAWEEARGGHAVLAPISLIVSAFAPIPDVRKTLTPELDLTQATRLFLIDLGRGKNRLGASCWAQVHGLTGGVPADLDSPELLADFFSALRKLKDAGLVLAYHDRSDGGLLVSLIEMAFASHCGLRIDLGATDDVIAACFAEELGVVLQVPQGARSEVQAILTHHGLADCAHDIGVPLPGDEVHLIANGRAVYSGSRLSLHRAWSETSFKMQELRDNPRCAREEYDRLLDAGDPGLSARLTFDPNQDVGAPFVARGARPQVAVLREQGVNSQVEMAAVFTRAGFDAFDVHMTDILSARVSLSRFHGLVACGGFSYGDVLGAGEGWAKSILFNPQAREEFATFFERSGTFTLGVCNGCQMLSALKELIPGAQGWPRFVRNRSEQYEARLGLVEITESRSILMAGMHGSVLPIAIAHGEGRADIGRNEAQQLFTMGVANLRYVDHRHAATERYPDNPNGSPLGLAGVTSLDGRVTAIMPHPERVYRTVQNSWHPRGWQEDGGWTRLFRNARVFLG